MLLTGKDLDKFQQCRLKWAKTREEHAKKKDSPYLAALKKTITQMYAWSMINSRENASFSKTMPLKTLRGKWDKNWYTWAINNKFAKHQKILDMTLKGWLTLSKYWANVYQEQVALPLITPFCGTTTINDIKFQISTDLVLIDKEDKIILMEFGSKHTSWHFYNALSTKLEIIAVEQMLATPNIKYFVDLEPAGKNTQQGYILKPLKMDEEYLDRARQIVYNVTSDIKNGVIYASPSDACKQCPVREDCWV